MFAWKIDIFLNCLKNRNLPGNLPGKSNLFLKLPEKREMFRKFTWKNRSLLPGSTTPRFQIRLTPLALREAKYCYRYNITCFHPLANSYFCKTVLLIGPSLSQLLYCSLG